MASEPSKPSSEAGPTSTARPMTRRRKKKLMFVVIVVAVAAIVVLWGWSATGAKDFLQVSPLVEDSSGGTIPAKYLNKTIEVQGVVVNWAGGTSDLNFSLADNTDATKTISVVLQGALPSEFANGKTAVVKGELEHVLPIRLVATEITLGCASRY